MIKRIVLPGSEGLEEDAGASGTRTTGRFTEDELGALAEVARWWRHRLTRSDSTDPLESHFGGVDAAGTARTVGLTPATVAFGRPLLPINDLFTGAALLVLALGAPDPPEVGRGLFAGRAVPFLPRAGSGLAQSLQHDRPRDRPDDRRQRQRAPAPGRDRTRDPGSGSAERQRDRIRGAGTAGTIRAPVRRRARHAGRPAGRL